MNLWQAIFLGAVQGLTEFVPISSTAHLFLLQTWLKLGNGAANLSFDIVLHLGTALALIVIYAKDLWGMVEGRAEDRALIVPLILGTIPGVLAGLFLLKRIEAHRTLAVIGVSMQTACAYFLFSEWLGHRRQNERGNGNAGDSIGVRLAPAAAGVM